MSMKAFRNKFYIVGFISLILMGFTIIFTFRTLFESLTTAYEVETEIPESELRINKQNLDRAYNSIVDYEPTRLEIENTSGSLPDADEEGEEEENDGLSQEEQN